MTCQRGGLRVTRDGATAISDSVEASLVWLAEARELRRSGPSPG